MNKTVLFIFLNLLALSLYANMQMMKSVTSSEKIILFSDRTTYITGEQIQIYASVFNENPSGLPVLSQILFIELINPSGDKFTTIKSLISNNGATCCIPIPLNLYTGTYYIKAYTKMMSNQGPSGYGYRQILIINPKRVELLPTDGKQDSSKHIPQIQKMVPGKDIQVKTNMSLYSSRDSIYLTIIPDRDIIRQIRSLSLSVVPDGTLTSNYFSLPENFKKNISMEFLEAVKGLSLTGRLTEGPENKLVKNKLVNLSIIGDGRDFMSTRTDSSGNFYFSLPEYYGSRDIFLCTERAPSTGVKIWVDNDFCMKPIRLPSHELKLSEKEELVLFKMALNKQISNHYRIDSTFNKKQLVYNNTAFYGKPTTILNLDQYIQLPTLEEYLNELPSLVRVREKKGEKYFSIIGSKDLSFYSPLVLIDWVAVDEPKKILAAMPQNISRIEIVNKAYVKGNQTYGGIISIISKKGDFAGIDLPSIGVFLNYQFLAEANCNTAFYDIIPTHPDCRNTILWEPNIDIYAGESKMFTFLAPDAPGKYDVILEGVTINGEIISVNHQFEVKK